MAVNITSDPTALQAGQDQAAEVDARNIQPQPEEQTPQAPTSGNVVGGVPGVAQPEVQNPQATNNAQAVNTVARQPVSQAHLHTGIFHTLLSRMNEGDQQVVRDKNGNPVTGPDGKPQTQPMNSKQMGRSILAGVLSAMAASEQHQPYRNGNGIWVNPQNEAVQAGEQAFQQRRPQAQFQQADKQLAQQRTQQYATYKSNVDMYKMAHEIAHMQAEDKQAAVASFAPTYEAAENGDIPGYNSETGDLSENDAETQLKQMDPTTHMMVPNGKVIPVLDDKGNPTGESQIHYMILPGQKGQIPLTKDMIADHPELKGAVEGKTIPLTQWMRLVRGQASKQILSSMVSDLAGTLTDDPKAEPVKFDYNKFVKDSKATPDQLSKLGNLSGDRNDPVAFAKGLKAIDPTGQLDQALRNQGVKIDAPAWEDKRKADLKKQETEDTRNADPDKVILSPEAIASVPADIKAAYPALTDAQIKAISKDMPDKGANALDRRRVMDKAAGINFQAIAAGQGNEADSAVDDFDDRGVNVGFINSLPPGAAASVRAYGEGRQIIPTGMGRTKEGKKSLEAVNRAYPEFKAGQSENYVKTRQDFLTGNTSKGLEAINTALGHAGKMYDNAGWLSVVPGVSTVLGTVGTQSQRDAVAAVNNAKLQLSTEIGRAYQNGVITSGEHEAQLKNIDAWTPLKLKSQLKSVVDFLESKIEDQRRKWENAIPQYMRNGDNFVMLNPTAAAAYTKITGHNVDPIIYGTAKNRPSGNQLPAGLSFQRPQQQQQQQ